MKKNFTKNNNRGFALLFSVLVSSLLLSIGLSIFSIALKELAISTAARQSVHAFFAADSGREYTLYHDLKIGDALPVDTTSNSLINQTATTSADVINGGANYIVAVTKYRAAGDNTADITTTIVSRGYDTDDDDKVERAIEQTY